MMHVYEVCPRKDKRDIDLISDVLPFGRGWYGGPEAIRNAIGYAQFYSRSHDAVIRVYDAAGNVIETHEHAGEFKELGEQPARAIAPRSQTPKATRHGLHRPEQKARQARVGPAMILRLQFTPHL
jgi:hypothetical protein